MPDKSGSLCSFMEQPTGRFRVLALPAWMCGGRRIQSQLEMNAGLPFLTLCSHSEVRLVWCLMKIKADKADSIMITPIWPAQILFPMLLELSYGILRILPAHQRFLANRTGNCHQLVTNRRLSDASLLLQHLSVAGIFIFLFHIFDVWLPIGFSTYSLHLVTRCLAKTVVPPRHPACCERDMNTVALSANRKFYLLSMGSHFTTVTIVLLFFLLRCITNIKKHQSTSINISIRKYDRCRRPIVR